MCTCEWYVCVCKGNPAETAQDLLVNLLHCQVYPVETGWVS